MQRNYVKKKNVAVEIKRPFPSASVSKGVQVQNLSNKNEFDLHFNEFVGKTDFHMKGFPLGLVLKQRQRELGNGLL